jgi:hypothetical protein
MVALAGCIGAKLEESGIVTCWGGVTMGDGVDLSEIGTDGAMWWVNIGPIGVGNQDGTRSANTTCKPTIYVSATVGYTTCYPINEDGQALTSQQQIVLTDLVMAARAALYRGISCCDWKGSYGIGEVVVTTWTPQGPQGGVLGGQWTVQVQIIANRPEPTETP